VSGSVVAEGVGNLALGIFLGYTPSAESDFGDVECVGPGNAAWALPGRVVHLVSTLPYCVAAGTRNHERLRATLWTTSR
jgi:hypothetical protein